MNSLDDHERRLFVEAYNQTWRLLHGFDMAMIQMIVGHILADVLVQYAKGDPEKMATAATGFHEYTMGLIPGKETTRIENAATPVDTGE